MASEPLPDIAAAYARNGFVVVRNLLDPKTVQAARDWHDIHSKTSDIEFQPLQTPLLVMWYHAEGGVKRYHPLGQAPAFEALARHPDILRVVHHISHGAVRLVESIVFEKPPMAGARLAWHQDASFYPLVGGSLVSALVAIDPMTLENGTVSFAEGSHLSDLKSAVNLHTGQRLESDVRDTPDDPEAAGFCVETPELEPGDVVFFHSRAWHGSGPNTTHDQRRRLLSLRYVTPDAIYSPIPGNSCTFMRQILTPVGEPLSGEAFPLLAP